MSIIEAFCSCQLLDELEEHSGKALGEEYLQYHHILLAGQLELKERTLHQLQHQLLHQEGSHVDNTLPEFS